MRILLGIFSGLADLFGRAQWWCFGVAARITDRMEPDIKSRFAWEHFQELTGWTKEDFPEHFSGRKA